MTHHHPQSGHHHHHPPAVQAGAIIAHYLRLLTIASGKRWTPSNDRDMRTLTELLAEAGASGESFPAFCELMAQAPERTTVSFDKPLAAEDDPGFVRWKREREQDDSAAVARMTRGRP